MAGDCGHGGRALGLKPAQTSLKLMSPSMVKPSLIGAVVVREPNVEGLAENVPPRRGEGRRHVGGMESIRSVLLAQSCTCCTHGRVYIMNIHAYTQLLK